MLFLSITHLLALDTLVRSREGLRGNSNNPSATKIRGAAPGESRREAGGSWDPPAGGAGGWQGTGGDNCRWQGRWPFCKEGDDGAQRKKFGSWVWDPRRGLGHTGCHQHRSFGAGSVGAVEALPRAVSSWVLCLLFQPRPRRGCSEERNRRGGNEAALGQNLKARPPPEGDPSTASSVPLYNLLQAPAALLQGNINYIYCPQHAELHKRGAWLGGGLTWNARGLRRPLAAAGEVANSALEPAQRARSGAVKEKGDTKGGLS